MSKHNGPYLISAETMKRLQDIQAALHGGTDRERDYGHKLWLALNDAEEISNADAAMLIMLDGVAEATVPDNSNEACIEAAEKHADLLEGEELERANVVNAFYAGVRWAEKTSAVTPAEPGCQCEACLPNRIPHLRFVVCAICGNKRCPHATDHRNECTNSNEPGQKGSAWEHAKRPG